MGPPDHTGSFMFNTNAFDSNATRLRAVRTPLYYEAENMIKKTSGLIKDPLEALCPLSNQLRTRTVAYSNSTSLVYVTLYPVNVLFVKYPRRKVTK